MSDSTVAPTAPFSNVLIANRSLDKHQVNIVNIDVNETESTTRTTYGKFVAFVTLSETCDQRIDAEIQVDRAIDDMIEYINEVIDHCQKMEVDQVKLEQSDYTRLGGNLWLVTVEYHGDTFVDASEYAEFDYNALYQLAMSLSL